MIALRGDIEQVKQASFVLNRTTLDEFRQTMLHMLETPEAREHIDVAEHTGIKIALLPKPRNETSPCVSVTWKLPTLEKNHIEAVAHFCGADTLSPLATPAHGAGFGKIT